MQQKLGVIPLSCRRVPAWFAERYLPIGFKGRNYLQGLGVDLGAGLPVIASYFDLKCREQLLC